MRVALGQFAVSKKWEENTDIAVQLMRKAQKNSADLLVLPEGILARDIADPDIVLKTAQPLDGPFMTRILEESRGSSMTIMATIHVPAVSGKVYNTFVSVRDGAIIGEYRKLHLYDAFSAQESENVQPGDEVPQLIEVAGFKLGTMTCYDVRFPELARRLVLDGADILVLPAAWVKGPNKEFHWETLVTARALENTSYMIAVGECGEKNIGASMVVDPLGIACIRAGEASALLFADIDRERLNYARRILPVLKNRRFQKPELA